MHNSLRRIRGAIGMGFIWAAAWGAVGTIPRWVLGINADAPFPLILGVLGFIAGAMFSGLLVVAEGRRSFDQMSVRRFAGWGALGGLLLSGLFVRLAVGWVELLTIPVTFAVASAVCASASLALARRSDHRELPSAGGDRL
jgi:hypothetical protein